MRSERCKCGKATRFGSAMTYHPCEGCDECKTTFSVSPDGHRDLVPHEWVAIYDERTREFVSERCDRCHIRRRESQDVVTEEPPKGDFRYGDDRTIHRTAKINVERHPKTGAVVAVWFRCMRLPFSDTICDESRAESLAGSEKGDRPLKAVVFER